MELGGDKEIITINIILSKGPSKFVCSESWAIKPTCGDPKINLEDSPNVISMPACNIYILFLRLVEEFHQGEEDTSCLPHVVHCNLNKF